MKKINKASCVMALLAATTLTGCNNSLDETVYSEILEQSYNYQKSDFASNIIGAYSVLHSATQMSLWQTQELSSCEAWRDTCRRSTR